MTANGTSVSTGRWRTVLLTALACFTLIFSYGCLGGTYGTGLSRPGSGFSDDSGGSVYTPSYTTIRVFVRTISGKPVRGLKVMVETARSLDTSSLTDIKGRAEGRAIVDPDEQITIRFFRSEKELGSHSVKRALTGPDIIEFNFIMDKGGIRQE